MFTQLMFLLAFKRRSRVTVVSRSVGCLRSGTLRCCDVCSPALLLLLLLITLGCLHSPDVSTPDRAAQSGSEVQRDDDDDDEAVWLLVAQYCDSFSENIIVPFRGEAWCRYSK